MQNLEEINLRIFEPCDDLRRYIKSVWFVTNQEGLKDEHSFKVLTDCCSGLVFNFGDSVTYEQDGVHNSKNHKITTMGPTRHLMKFIFKGRVRAVGIRFFPNTGHHYFSVPMEELIDKIIETNSDHCDFAQGLYKDLDNLDDDKDIQTCIEKALIKKIDKIQFDQKLDEIIKYIDSNPEATTQELSDTFSISSRDIQRKFKNFVGVSPSVYARVQKITKAKTVIAKDGDDSLTDVSHESGYFDQAHFNREFKTFMDETPKKYRNLKKKKV